MGKLTPSGNTRRVNVRTNIAATILCASVMLAGCSGGDRPLDADEQAIRSVLALLAAPGLAICVDDSTAGNSLDVYREMTKAPSPTRDGLRWHLPMPLRPPSRFVMAQLQHGSTEEIATSIAAQMSQSAPLDDRRQAALDRAARAMARPEGTEQTQVPLRTGVVPQGVDARWWLLNRLSSGCWPQYRIGSPVRTGRLAFVSVRAEHWETLYAVRSGADGWKPFAEWTRWVY